MAHLPYNVNYGGVLRLLPNGSRDTSFGSSGLATLLVNGIAFYLRWGQVLSDGKIVVAGSIYQNQGSETSSFAVMRLLSNGTIDASFGVNGSSSSSINNKISLASAAAMDVDGKILVAGVTRDGIAQISRFKVNGGVDSTFGTSGTWIYSSADGYADIKTIAVLSTGKILGMTTLGINAPRVFRLNTNGTFDASFGINGFFIPVLDLPQLISGTSLAINSDGSFYMIGSAISTNQPFWIYAGRANGATNTAWGTNGQVTFSLGQMPNTYVYGLVQTDGKLLLGTQKNTPNIGVQLLVARLTSEKVGILSFEPLEAQTFIYPNPVAEYATFEYTLKTNETLSAYLSDATGKVCTTLFKQIPKQTGKHQDVFYFPASLAKGVYFLTLDNGKSKNTIRIVKP